MKLNRGLFLLMVFLSQQLFAETTSGISHTIHHHYASPRALGMGDSFVAVADDYNALFYNPAGLALREDGELNMDLSLAINSQIFSFLNDVQNAQNTTGSDSEKQQAVMNVLSKTYGTTYGGRGGLGGVLVRPNWGLGVILADGTLELTPHQQVGPSINATFYLDTTLAYGYARKVDWIPKSVTSWGITGKFVNRGYFSKSINAIELATDPNVVKSTDLKEGYTVDFDIGMMSTPEIPETGFFSFLKATRPTFGAVVRNAFELGFGQSLKLFQKEKTDAPEKMYRVIDLGSKWEFPKLWIFGGRGVFDIRDILHPAFSSKKGLHLGAEFDWKMFSWWRGQWRVGVNQGYWTAGVSALLGIFNLDLYSYGEEVGVADAPSENRVYGLRMNLNF